MIEFKCKCDICTDQYEGCHDRCPSYLAAWLAYDQQATKERRDKEIFLHIGQKNRDMSDFDAKRKKEKRHLITKG